MSCQPFDLRLRKTLGGSMHHRGIARRPKRHSSVQPGCAQEGPPSPAVRTALRQRHRCRVKRRRSLPDCAFAAGPVRRTDRAPRPDRAHPATTTSTPHSLADLELHCFDVMGKTK